MVAIINIIIIILKKVTCVNIRTSDKIKENFSYVEMPVWCMLLVYLSAKRHENFCFPPTAMSLNCTGQVTVVCALSL